MSQSELSHLTEQVSALTKSVEYLVKRQQKQEELLDDMVPIAKLALDASITKLDALERDGTLDFARELAGIGVRVREGFSPADVRQFGDAVVSILDAVKALTKPEILRIAQDASEALEHADDAKPLGLIGMVRATKNSDVQRGMSVMIEVLKRVGHGVNAMDVKQGAKGDKKKSLARMLGPKRKTLGTERRLPPAQAQAQAARPRPPSRGANAIVAKTCVTIDGVEFCTNGHMVDAAAWNRSIASAIGLAEGLELGDQHWTLIAAARDDFLASGASPNIRRLTIITELSTRDIYRLFPKAPGRTIARIAGCPKPAGCL
jgi:tRNA 2-thiouridine synthesizing protein E